MGDEGSSNHSPTFSVLNSLSTWSILIWPSYGLAKGMFTCQRRDIRVSGCKVRSCGEVMFQPDSQWRDRRTDCANVLWPGEFAECATAMRHELIAEESRRWWSWRQFSSLARHNDKLSGTAALVIMFVSALCRYVVIQLCTLFLSLMMPLVR